MPRIATFVFFDTETTGLPKEENNRTKITELSVVAVQRDHLLDQSERLSRENILVRPRVINKLTLCLNPRRLISDVSSSTSGLTNDLLENQTHFDERVFAMLDNFLKVLPKPVCLVAHNGHGFDFPMLKNHLEKINGNLPDDILCADSIYGLYDLTKKNKEEQISEISFETNITQDELPLTTMQAINENTPKKNKAPCPRPRPGKKRKVYFEGLLLLTGVFWGCTNPFIRQGTKGLRDVTAKSRLGQVWAEVTFLLGNWKYVVPWLINQAGSLVYLAAVQRTPLSIAVPTANSAAFALTAVTGAAIGTEQPLDAGSILGILCIMAGTVLCCWDKAD